MLDITGGAGAEALNGRYGGLDAQDLLSAAMLDLFPGRIAVVSSFGADSMALLHMVARVDRTLPVLFLETGKHFPETLEYRDAVARALGLTNVVDVKPLEEDLVRDDPDGTLHSRKPDACCTVRKIRPLERALGGFGAWITGRRRAQVFTRGGMQAIEPSGDRIKFNPLARWSRADVDAYIERHDLPRNPLVAYGYLSIGCMPCTSPVANGEHARSGRWRGQIKTECGIHAPS